MGYGQNEAVDGDNIIPNDVSFNDLLYLKMSFFSFRDLGLFSLTIQEGKSIMDYGEDGSTEGDKAIPDTSDANLDRSKVHVLLCDKDPDSSLHVMKLLQQCLYQGTDKSI